LSRAIFKSKLKTILGNKLKDNSWHSPDLVPEISSDDHWIIAIPLAEKGPMIEENFCRIFGCVPQALAVVIGATPHHPAELT